MFQVRNFLETIYVRLLRYKFGWKKATQKIFNQRYIMDQVRGSESCDKEQESTDCLDEPGYADKYHGKSTAQ